jgi:hypothetical protein
MLEIKKQFGTQLTLLDISLTEKRMACRFPKDYSSFLINFNCVIPHKKNYHIKKVQLEECIDVFFGINISISSLDLEQLFQSNSDFFPMGVIPIGEDPGGNYICLNLKEGIDYGKVYFYDQEVENEDDEGNITWDNMYLVADSFKAFIELLH